MTPPLSVLVPFFSGPSVVGFSGSRSLPLAAPVASVCRLALAGSASRFVVGCASGVDAASRAVLGAFAEVFFASAYGVGRSSFARRSVACVSAVAGAGTGGLWVCFAGSSCPAGVAPSASSSRCFCGAGSGTWASLAFAAGSRCRCLLWCAAGVSPPPSWGFVAVPDATGWWSFVPPPVPVQLSLF